MALVPTSISQLNNFEISTYPTTSWKINKDTNMLEYCQDDLQLVNQAIEIRLQIERNQFKIYSDNAGMETLDLPGKDFSLIIAYIKRRITDCLRCDDRVIGINNYNYIYPLNDDKHSILITFTVNTIYGKIDKELNYTI